MNAPTSSPTTEADCRLHQGCAGFDFAPGAVCCPLADGSFASCCENTLCGNWEKDPEEADVDCGGVCPTKCAVDKLCGHGTDCESGLCDVITARCKATEAPTAAPTTAESGKHSPTNANLCAPGVGLGRCTP